MSLAKGNMTIREAARLAHAQGVIGDYYSLDSEDTAALRDILQHTSWRQSKFSKEQGHSTLYAFHQALKRYIPKPTALSKGKRERAEAMEKRGEKYWEAASNTTIAVIAKRRTVFYPGEHKYERYSVLRVRKVLARFREALASYNIAADLYEEIGDTNKARNIRKGHNSPIERLTNNIREAQEKLDRIHRGMEVSDYVRPARHRPRPRALRDSRRPWRKSRRNVKR